MSDPVPQLFLEALSDLTRSLEAAHVPAMVVGGVAASILGRPRTTRDIDALVSVGISVTAFRYSENGTASSFHSVKTSAART